MFCVFFTVFVAVVFVYFSLGGMPLFQDHMSWLLVLLLCTFVMLAVCVLLFDVVVVYMLYVVLFFFVCGVFVLFVRG